MNRIRITNSVQYHAIVNALKDSITSVQYSCGTEREAPFAYRRKFEGASRESTVIAIRYVGEELRMLFEDDGCDHNIEKIYRAWVNHDIWFDACEQDRATLAEWCERFDALKDEYDVEETEAFGGGAACGPYSVFECESETNLNYFLMEYHELRIEYYRNEILAQIRESEA